ncbi:MAG: ATP-binding protein [Myxococcales bacterium]|nr:ATP-binding protein [Myxococcota bacterium]MDW8282115.1 ATP-binding protein [Myxococcales bacterium]
MRERSSGGFPSIDPAGEPAAALLTLVENHPHHAALLWGAQLRCVALSRPLRRYFAGAQSWDPAMAGAFLESSLHEAARRVLHGGTGEIVSARLPGGVVEGVQLCPAGLGGVVVLLPSLPQAGERSQRAREPASLRAILDALPLPLVVAFGPRGEERLLNAAAMELLGASERDEAPGTTLLAVEDRWGKRRGDGSPLPEEARPLRRALLERETVLGLEVSFAHPSQESPTASGTQERRVYLESAAPILSPTGEQLGAVAVFQDITEHKRADRQKDQFLAMVGHELRTPLTVLRTQTQLISRWLDELPAEQVRQVAEGIDRQAERISQVVDDLLDMGRLQTGQVDLRPQRLDLAELARDAMGRLGTTGEFVLQSEGPVPVVGDLLRLQQVVSILLGNAQRSAPPGTPVIVRTFAQDGFGHLSVHDRGPSVSQRDRERIFERFYRPESPARGDGSGLGLGLWISRKLIELMGGQIWVEGEGLPLGQGATFTFRLPQP